MSWSPSGSQYPSSASKRGEIYEPSSSRNYMRRSPSIEMRESEPPNSVPSASAPSQVTQHREIDENHSSYSKGKGKAVVNANPSLPKEDLETPSSETKRISRFSDIQASIQAHLGSERARKPPPLKIKGPASSSSTSKPSTLKIKGQGKPSLSSQSSPPSLLSRISDTSLGEDSNPVTAALSSPSLSNDHPPYTHPGDEVGGQLTRDEPRTLPLSPERMSDSSMNTFHGLQDTQAMQSRARDDRLMTNNEIENLSPVSNHEGSSASAFLTKRFRSASNDSESNTHVDSGLSDGRRMNGEELGSDPRPSFIQVSGSHTTVSNLNMRLFHKLAEEKRHLQDNNLSATLSNSEDSGDVVVGRNSVVVPDPQAIEAKPRARAQLRMRLVTEKRALSRPQ
ncbi:hypothetical protein EV361DRAFT_584950 [Lentinula raphanica]|nr:hypothetical protein EV361DRAFT_584950 [Lentinula raphanica]